MNHAMSRHLFQQWQRRLETQKAFEKCWAHSPLRAATRRLFYIAIHQVSLLSHAATVAYRLCIDVHNIDNNDNNALQRGPLWPHGIGPISQVWLQQTMPSLETHQSYTRVYKYKDKNWQLWYHVQAVKTLSITHTTVSTSVCIHR